MVRYDPAEFTRQALWPALQTNTENFRMTTYTNFWRKKADGMIVKVSVTPYGWDDHAYFAQELAKSGARKFKVIEEQRLSGEDAPSAVVESFFKLRMALADVATEIFPVRKTVIFPEDIVEHREKTAEECLMDEAALWVEIEQYDRAEQLLASVYGNTGQCYVFLCRLLLILL